MGVKIAIFGGIGSGKSSVSEIIRRRGHTVLDCDEIYKKEVLTSSEFVSLLVNKFGSDILKDKAVDTRALGKIIYSDKENKKWLDAIAHPLILQRLKSKMQGCGMIFAEVPLLYESGWKDMFDAAVLVSCDSEVRVSRLISHRYKTEGEEYVRKVIASQTSEDKLKSIADYTVDNSGTPKQLQKNVDTLLQFLQQKFYADGIAR